MKRRLSKTYIFFGAWNKIAISNFYKRKEIVNYEANMPTDVPILLCPNHQNALIDALNTAGTMKWDRQPTFMTRADVFGTLFDPILYKFKMLPIYRQRDKVNVIEKNEEIFRICIERLSRGESIIIFPEGNHDRNYRIRPLKKGFARIAFQAEAENDYQLNMVVVPVGLNYDNHLKFRSDLLVVFGEKIAVSDYYEQYQEAPNRALIAIRNVLRDRLRQCVLHIAPGEFYDMTNELRQILRPQMLKKMNLTGESLYEGFQADKATIALLEEKIAEQGDELEKLKKTVADYVAGIKKMKLREHVIAEGPFSMAKLLGVALLLILGSPVYLYGIITNYIPYKIADILTLKNFKDDHFHSSIRMVISMFLFPLFYLLLTGAIWAASASWWVSLLVLVSLPVSGKFAIIFSEEVKKWYSRFKFNRLKSKKDSFLHQMLQLRREIFERVSPWIEKNRQPTH